VIELIQRNKQEIRHGLLNRAVLYSDLSAAGDPIMEQEITREEFTRPRFQSLKIRLIVEMIMMTLTQYDKQRILNASPNQAVLFSDLKTVGDLITMPRSSSLQIR